MLQEFGKIRIRKSAGFHFRAIDMGIKFIPKSKCLICSCNCISHKEALAPNCTITKCSKKFKSNSSHYVILRRNAPIKAHFIEHNLHATKHFVFVNFSSCIKIYN